MPVLMKRQNCLSIALHVAHAVSVRSSLLFLCQTAGEFDRNESTCIEAVASRATIGALIYKAETTDLTLYNLQKPLASH